MLSTIIRKIVGRKKQSVQFDPATLPWLDRPNWKSVMKDKLRRNEICDAEASMLSAWVEDGFIALKGVAEHATIDALWRDEERAWKERPPCRILCEGIGVSMLKDSRPKEELTHHHYRLMDFHNLSEAGAKIMMHPTIIRTLSLLFGEPVAAMQSLLFKYGSEQHLHQDFPYVHSGIPSHLIGGWVACEHADEENGSLLYYPGSHRIPLFDFGDGSALYKNDDPRKIDAFEAYLSAECRKLRTKLTILRAEKGDALLWHGASCTAVRRRNRSKEQDEAL